MDGGMIFLGDDRAKCDLHIDPTQMEIRSERKAFELENPVG